jgi:VWFA-related protein
VDSRQFRAEVDLITVDVTVLDEGGRPVSGLRADEFIVLEDGRPQNVSAFLEVSVPPPQRDALDRIRTGPTDVVVNELEDQRLIVLLLDDATLPPDPRVIREARRAARSVIEGLGAADLAAVVFTRDNRAAQDFTRDRARLIAAVDRLDAGFLGGGNAASPGPTGDVLYYVYSVSALTRLADELAALPHRRKLIAYISIGLPIPDAAGGTIFVGADPSLSPARAGEQPEYLARLKGAIERAQRANVTVYAFDPTGLGGIAGYNKSHPFAPIEVGGQEDYLLSLAHNTGGRAVTRTNNLEPGVARMLEETRVYYLLGYDPNPRGRAGQYRRIQVSTTRRGLQVRTRSGYFVPSVTGDAELALAS